MLIQFSARNFKSFKDTFTLDLFTNKDQSVSAIYDCKFAKVYPSTVFYGANGSGKSNVLKAFQMMRKLVLNEDKIVQSTDSMPVNTFKLSDESQNDSTSFDITFVFEGKKYRYGFEYGAEENKTIVYGEYLYVYESFQPTTVFEYDIEENNGKIKITKYKELEKIKHLENSLFLWEADRYTNEPAAKVLQWFKNTQMIEYSSELYSLNNYDNLLEKPEIKEIVKNFIHDADFGINDIFQEENFEFQKSSSIQAIVYALFQNQKTIKTTHTKYTKEDPIGEVKFNLLEDESFGTQKYFFVIGPVIEALLNGSTLFLDELDASLHPILTRKIVKLFNSKESNPKGGQIIFTSQDTNLLDQSLFDKEQIWFTEKDKYGCSHITSLSEYKDIRKNEKIEQKYIMGKFGAIPYLGDFKF